MEGGRELICQADSKIHQEIEPKIIKRTLKIIIKYKKQCHLISRPVKAAMKTVWYWCKNGWFNRTGQCLDL